MTLTKTNIGTSETGAPLHHFHSDGHVVVTGPATGVVVTSDGTRYDVTEPVIEVTSPEHAGEVAHLVAERVEESGHPLHDNYEPFAHYCTDSCGALKRDVTDPTQLLMTDRVSQAVSGIQDPQVRYQAAQGLGVDVGGAPGLTMARASAAAENAALNGLDGTGSTNVIPYVGLNTGDPSTTGANENANTGSYARQACSWNAASGGTKTNSSSLSFLTAGSVAVTYVSTWSSVTYGAGTYAIGGALGSSVTAASITVAAGAISLAAT